MNILIADDEAVSREIVTIALRKFHCPIVVACGGEEAWERLQTLEMPAIVILDWMMPEIDGLELCRRIRSLGRLSSCYIIMLTGKSAISEIAESLDAGADDYIVKPFDLQELHARVLLGQRMMQLHEGLTQRLSELRDLVEEIHQLQTISPVGAESGRTRGGNGNGEDAIDAHWSRCQALAAVAQEIRITRVRAGQGSRFDHVFRLVDALISQVQTYIDPEPDR